MIKKIRCIYRSMFIYKHFTHDLINHCESVQKQKLFLTLKSMLLARKSNILYFLACLFLAVGLLTSLPMLVGYTPITIPKINILVILGITSLICFCFWRSAVQKIKTMYNELQDIISKESM